jgi:hypothetical protein
MSPAGRHPGHGPGDGTTDAELGRLLDRRSSLSGALREAVDAEGPAGEVDEAIRAAARRAVVAGPQSLPGDDIARAGGSRGARRWWPAARLPLAAAAMLMVTVSVALLVEREQHTLESTTDRLQGSASGSVPGSSVLPPGAAARPEGVATTPVEDGRGLAAGRAASQTPDASPASPASPASRLAPARTAPAQSVESMAPAPSSSPEPAPSRAAGVARERPAADEESQSMRRSVAPMAARPPPPPRPAPATVMASDGAAPVASASLPPDRWLQQILELRRSGRAQEATEALTAFRKAWPDHPLPPELSAAP